MSNVFTSNEHSGFPDSYPEICVEIFKETAIAIEIIAAKFNAKNASRDNIISGMISAMTTAILNSGIEPSELGMIYTEIAGKIFSDSKINDSRESETTIIEEEIH